MINLNFGKSQNNYMDHLLSQDLIQALDDGDDDPFSESNVPPRSPSRRDPIMQVTGDDPPFSQNPRSATPFSPTGSPLSPTATPLTPPSMRRTQSFAGAEYDPPSSPKSRTPTPFSPPDSPTAMPLTPLPTRRARSITVIEDDTVNHLYRLMSQDFIDSLSRGNDTPLSPEPRAATPFSPPDSPAAMPLTPLPTRRARSITVTEEYHLHHLMSQDVIDSLSRSNDTPLSPEPRAATPFSPPDSPTSPTATPLTPPPIARSQLQNLMMTEGDTPLSPELRTLTSSPSQTEQYSLFGGGILAPLPVTTSFEELRNLPDSNAPLKFSKAIVIPPAPPSPLFRIKLLFEELVSATPCLPESSSSVRAQHVQVVRGFHRFDTCLSYSDETIQKLRRLIKAVPQTEELAEVVYVGLNQISLKLTATPLPDPIDLKHLIDQTLASRSLLDDNLRHYRTLCEIASHALKPLVIPEDPKPTARLTNEEAITAAFRKSPNVSQKTLNALFNTLKGDWASGTATTPEAKKFLTSLNTLYFLCEECYLSLPKGLMSLQHEVYQFVHSDKK